MMLVDEDKKAKIEEEKADLVIDDLKVSIFPNPEEKKSKKMTTTLQSGTTLSGGGTTLMMD